MNIVVVTDIPSPYQVEYFDSISDHANFRAIYLSETHATRRYWKPAQLKHEGIILDRLDDAETRLYRCMDEADLVVFSNYRSSVVRRAMARRAVSARPWCFWGERLGSGGFGIVGRASRRILLRALHRSRAPIWTMGSWAIESYQREFGAERHYFNVPYCSNLARFAHAGDKRTSTDTFRFLYSGSLIHRKGVDLLARAFIRLANKLPHVSLTLLATAGALRSQLEAVLAPVSERVSFIDTVDWTRLPEYYARADALCAPSRYDGWGMIVAEGLASGLPVISTDRMGAAVEIVKLGKNGWVIPADDVDALYRAMLEAATMGSIKWREMSECAKTVVEAHGLESGTRRFLAAANVTLAERL